MNIELALEIVGRIGTDNPPSLSDLKDARDTIARELHSLKGTGADLEAVTSLRATYDVAADAYSEAEKAAEEAAKSVEEALDGVPDPDASLSEDTPAEDPPADPDPDPEPQKILSAREAIKRLGLAGDENPGEAAEVTRAPVTTKERPQDPSSSGLEVTTHEVIIGDQIVDDATLADLAAAFADGRTRREGRERIARITTQFADDRTIANLEDKAANTSLVDTFVTPEAVSAAGGCCSLPTPIYDNPVNISTNRPIRDSLPTLGVQGRGAVSFYPAICFPDEGAALWTCEQDEAVDPDDPDTWKECADVDCGESDEARVEGIYACMNVGRMQREFAREEWEGRLRAVAGLQARIAEVSLFNQMWNAASTLHTGAATGSVIANVVQALALATATMRQDERLADVQFDWTAPGWLQEAILSDSIARRLRGVGNVENGQGLLAEALGDLNVRAIWTLDTDPIEEGTGSQSSGDLNAFPDLANTILAPNGFYTFLDGGQFDLGTEIVDMDNARMNRVSAFAESFEGLLARGCNAKGLSIPVEVCDSVPCD